MPPNPDLITAGNGDTRGCNPWETGARYLRRHGEIVAFVVVLVLTIAGAWYVSQSQPDEPDLGDAPALSPYTVLSRPELMARSATECQSSQGTATAAVTVKAIGKSAPINHDDVVCLPATPKDWRILSVPLPKQQSLVKDQVVALVGVAPPFQGNTFGTLVSEQALVVATAEGQAVLAVPKAEAVAASSYLSGESRLLIMNVPTVQPGTPTPTPNATQSPSPRPT